MREIKFRAWHNDKMMMVRSLHNTHSQVNIRAELCDPDGGFGKGNPAVTSEVIVDNLMQYTGLKDKNGVEIYEGDIVEMANAHYLVPAGPYKDMAVVKGDRRQVKSLESGFTLCHIGTQTSDIPNIAGHVDNYNFWNQHHCFEVIGNIYENPELLSRDGDV